MEIESESVKANGSPAVIPFEASAIEGREAAERFVDLITRGEYRSLCWRLIPRKGFDGTIREPEIPLDTFYEQGFDDLQGDYNVFAVARS